jgi:hypothetical protein
MTLQRIILKIIFMIVAMAGIFSPELGFSCAQSGAQATAGADSSAITQGDATGKITFMILNTCLSPADITRIRFYFTTTWYELAPTGTQNPPPGWTATVTGNGRQLNFWKDATPTGSISEGESNPFTPVLQGPGPNGTPLRNENYEYADNYFNRVRIYYSDGTNRSFWNPNPIGYCTPGVNCTGPTAWGWLFHGLKIPDAPQGAPIGVVATPSPVNVGATITVTITVENRLNAPYQANGVTVTSNPSDPTKVLLLTAPPPANIPAGGSAIFIFTYQAIASIDPLTFTAGASGIRSGSNNPLTAVPVVSNDVIIGGGKIRPLEWREIF